MAAEKVFAIPELLETILENLLFLDLVCAERINSWSRDTIQRSDRLQRKLFLKSSFEEDRSPKGVSTNAVLRHINFLPWFTTQTPSKTSVRDAAWIDWDNIEVYIHSEVWDKLRRRRRDIGSWENMYASDPPCIIRGTEDSFCDGTYSAETLGKAKGVVTARR